MFPVFAGDGLTDLPIVPILLVGVLRHVLAPRIRRISLSLQQGSQ